MIVLRHGALALSNLDIHSRLVVLVSGEDLRLFSWDHCVAAGELGHDTSHSLNSERHRCRIQLEVLATLTARNASLHCSTIGHSFIRIDATVRLLAIEEILG